MKPAAVAGSPLVRFWPFTNEGNAEVLYATKAFLAFGPVGDLSRTLLCNSPRCGEEGFCPYQSAR